MPNVKLTWDDASFSSFHAAIFIFGLFSAGLLGARNAASALIALKHWPEMVPLIVIQDESAQKLVVGAFQLEIADNRLHTTGKAEELS